MVSCTCNYRATTDLADRRFVVSRPELDELDRAAVVTLPVLLTIPTVAGVLACSPRTVWRRIEDGSLPAVVEHDRLMVRADELRDYIDELARPQRTSRRRRARSTRSPYARIVQDDRS